MVEANLGLVGFVLRRWGTWGSEEEDAFQDGVLGLVRAVQKFEPERNIKFATYAVPWIRQSIERGRGRMQGVDYRRAVALGSWDAYQSPLSLDADNGVLAEFVGREDAVDLDANRLVDEVLAVCLDDIDRTCVYGAAEGATLRKIGASLGVSGEAVRRRLGRIRERVLRARAQRERRVVA